MAIKIIRTIKVAPPDVQGGVVALGNFDGVHMGHQALLQRAVTIAKKINKPSVVLTFNPHPAEWFGDKKSFVRLSTLHDKVAVMQQLGIDYLIFIKFNQYLANQEAGQFVSSVLNEALHAKYIVIGDDFRFGYKRQGDVAYLKSLEAEYHFTVEALPQYDYQGERVSSTRVRSALGQGNLALAMQLLGRPFVISGRVQYGDAIGRTLGFPTINLPWRHTPSVAGIFTVKVHGLASSPIFGVASSGTRPAVGGSKPILEVHLLDFDRMVYGECVTVEFCHKLRDEWHFANLDALKAQIALDVAVARAYFTGKQ